MTTRQKLTIQLDGGTIRKAKVLAAKQRTSVSVLVAALIEQSVAAEDAYEAARRNALEMLELGFHLGGAHPNRDALQRT